MMQAALAASRCFARRVITQRVRSHEQTPCSEPSTAADRVSRPVAIRSLVTTRSPAWRLACLSPLLLTLTMAGVISVTLTGCSMYQYGARSMFRDDIRTIHVPIARNDTFRHDLGPRLTEAVIRQIELRTPYKVTGDPAADSTLRLRVIRERKSVLTESASDDPAALDAVVAIEVDWIDRRGGPLLRDQWSLETAGASVLTQGNRFVPEAGQSVQVALQEALEDLADRVVSQMELRW